jgi:acylphosphatase
MPANRRPEVAGYRGNAAKLAPRYFTSLSISLCSLRSFVANYFKHPMKRVTVFYSGRVQGVGFRVTVRQLACGYDVTGIVRNLPDSRVEMIAEGAPAELKAFLTGIAERELSGFIAKQHETWQPALGNFCGFVITH